MIAVSAISTVGLRDGLFERDLPEFYDLKSSIENNSWHTNDATFTHTLAVLESFESIRSKLTNNNINSYLSKKVGQHTRGQLLFLAIVFHDIAKPNTIITRDDGSTSCPNHEEQGAIKVGPILDRFDLSENEKEVVQQIVRNHGLIHQILGLSGEEFDSQFADWQKRFSDIYPELILLAMADTAGAQLHINNPSEFTRRMDFYHKFIQDF